MKLKIETILPIALSLILPGFSLYSNAHIPAVSGVGTYSVWTISAVFMYMLWHLLWHMWEIRSRYKILWIALVILVFSAVLAMVIKLINPQREVEITGYLPLRVLLGASIFMLIQYALKAEKHFAHLRLEKEQLKTENYKAQLRALRAQIDPHFLFNSLNTLRSMVRQQHANAEKFIISLSDFYRQTLQHNENITLRLSEELDVLQSYLFLMKSRHEEAVSVHIQVDESLLPFHLPAMALQVVVENCFKHNSMTSKKPLCINITNTDDYCIQVRNNIQPKIGEQDSSGLGLELLRKRYGLMNIPNGLQIEETSDFFSVKLKLV